MDSPEPSAHDLSALRQEYSKAGLTESDAGDDPVVLLQKWVDDAVDIYGSSDVGEPNAMTLATATPEGRPSARMVLLKGLDDRGLVFHTHRESRKGRELAANPRAAAVLHWHPLQRQIRVEGPVAWVSAAESDEYFRTRPRGGQIGALASHQSEPIADRATLQRQFEEFEAEAGDGPIVRPEEWGGYRIGLEVVEFWQGRPNRLHDRIRFARQSDGWQRERLQP